MSTERPPKRARTDQPNGAPVGSSSSALKVEAEDQNGASGVPGVETTEVATPSSAGTNTTSPAEECAAWTEKWWDIYPISMLRELGMIKFLDVTEPATEQSSNRLYGVMSASFYETDRHAYNFCSHGIHQTWAAAVEHAMIYFKWHLKKYHGDDLPNPEDIRQGSHDYSHVDTDCKYTYRIEEWNDLRLVDFQRQFSVFVQQFDEVLSEVPEDTEKVLQCGDMILY